jgi:maltoporin
MYFWNDVHSTWLETGYQIVDYSEGGRNSGWKATLSQNISIGMGPSFRPMLRFYVTAGEVNNKHNRNILNNDDRLNALNIGAMWEAWW